MKAIQNSDMRGFLIVEILIAFTILTMLIVATSLTALTVPAFVANAELEEGALEHARNILGEGYVVASSSFSSLASIASSSDGVFTTSLHIHERDDEAYASIDSIVSWNDVFGRPITLILSSRTDNPASTTNPCDSFVSGDWSHPRERATYSLPQGGISALAATASMVIVGIGTTSSAELPTLSFYSAHGTQPELQLIAEFDTANTSRVGVSSLAVGDRYLFAGNAFGSKSPSTCASDSCAQIHVFTISPGSMPRKVGVLSLATSSEPYALLATGESAPAVSLTYSKGFLYLGLRKTGLGDEFNVIDAHDPEHLRWISGYRVGRTVSHITIRGTFAYLSTDDPSRELLVMDIRNPAHPTVAGSWDAPGSIGFGYGTASTVRDGVLRFGRSYSSNSPEMVLLDAYDPAHITQIQGEDRGTPKDTQSVRAFLQQDTLLFSLLSRRLEFWGTSDSKKLTPLAPSYLLPAGADGAALSCRDNLIYVGWNINGVGIIRVLQGS